MRPLQLKLQAFGPFAHSEQIDFSNLGTQTLFLINGVTGTGKTMLLDAICFALYGKTSGNEREGGQLRCDYAESNLLTEVDFTFKLNQQQYRIQRSPDQERPKQRGAGFTEHKHTATLWRIENDGHETVLSSRKATQATDHIKDLLGLDVEQFRQVIILPQGKFRQLLLAKSTERAKVFSQLFDAHIYKKLEDAIAERAKEVRKAVKDIHEKQKAILEIVGFEDIATLQTNLSELEPQQLQLQRKKQSANKTLEQAQQAFLAAKQLNQAFYAYDQTQQQLNQLNTQEAEITTFIQRYQQSQIAQTIKPLLDQMQTIEQQSAQQQQLIQAQQHQVNHTQANAEKLKQQTALLKQESTPKLESLQQKTSYLESLKPRAEQITSYRQNLEQSQKKQQTAHIALAKAQQNQEQLKQHYENTKKQIQHIHTHQTDITDLNQQLSQTKEQLKQSIQLQQYKDLQRTLEQQFNQQQEYTQQTESLFKQTDQKHKQLQLAWHQGQASLLALQLQANQPCPVCGSCEHPNPAQTTIDIPNQLQLEQAQQQVDQAQINLNQEQLKQKEIETRLEQQQEQVQWLEQQLGNLANVPIDTIQQQKENLKQAIQDWENNENKRKQLTQQQTQINQQLAETEKSLEPLNQAYIDINNEVLRQQTILDSALAELPADYQTIEQLSQALAATQTQHQTLRSQLGEAISNTHKTKQETIKEQTRLDEQQQQLIQLQTQLNQAKQAWETALQEHHIDSTEMFHTMHLDQQQQAELQQHIEQYQQRKQYLNTLLVERSQQISGKESPDLNQFEHVIEAAQIQKQAIENELQEITQQIKILNQSQQSYAKEAQYMAEHEEAYTVIGTLADAVQGNNAQRLSLHRFVLSALLDDVLVIASQHFYQMSKSRYLLKRKEERNKGNTASGLDLVVEDTQTDTIRDVATLSGGESFMAALSLALGLSEVIQNHSGGIKLDTLFIDEGFGSLDTESLELAIRTLMELQHSGRTVGLISHVTELKQQIQQRIDIKVNAQGVSKIKVIGV